jgi:hypothetical protein
MPWIAIAELLALREQVGNVHPRRQEADADYDPKDRSLANTMRALRQCMRNLAKYANSTDDLLHGLAHAQVQKYNNHTHKRARYRPKNPDKKPLGEPVVTPQNRQQRDKLRKINQHIAA